MTISSPTSQIAIQTADRTKRPQHQPDTVQTQYVKSWVPWGGHEGVVRNQIINSVHDQYISKLKHKITQYSNVTPLQLLIHLQDTYDQVTSDDLTANYTLYSR